MIGVERREKEGAKKKRERGEGKKSRGGEKEVGCEVGGRRIRAWAESGCAGQERKGMLRGNPKRVVTGKTRETGGGGERAGPEKEKRSDEKGTHVDR